MRTLIILLLLTPGLFSCQKTSEKKINSPEDKTTKTKNITDRDKAGLRGDVKEVTETSWYPKPGQNGISPGEKTGETKYTYDQDGNLLNTDSMKSKRIEILNIPGWAHKYSENGNIIESLKINDDGTIAEKHTYRYGWKDHHGNWREKYEYKNDAVLTITKRDFIYFD